MYLNVYLSMYFTLLYWYGIEQCRLGIKESTVTRRWQMKSHTVTKICTSWWDLQLLGPTYVIGKSTITLTRSLKTKIDSIFTSPRLFTKSPFLKLNWPNDFDQIVSVKMLIKNKFNLKQLCDNKGYGFCNCSSAYTNVLSNIVLIAQISEKT